jgi:hypothetical protein
VALSWAGPSSGLVYMAMHLPNAPLSTAWTEVSYGPTVPMILYGRLVERIFPTLTLTCILDL